ncbi:MAG: anti-sigma factor antagonist [Planctomycetota bacterium]|nr:MAG: anti-sigma factor antagonist [Planctomycetota bacterium]
MDKIQPKIAVDYYEDATIVTLKDEQILDESEVQALANSLMPLVEEADGINLVIDFGNVKFLTSAVLGLLIRASKKVYESGGQLKLCSINPKIFEIFRITRLDRVFDIYADRSEATQGLNPT